MFIYATCLTVFAGISSYEDGQETMRGDIFSINIEMKMDWQSSCSWKIEGVTTGLTGWDVGLVSVFN